MADGGHFGFFQLQILPTLFRGTPPAIFFKNFEEDKTTGKGTFALHGHGSLPNDPTNYQQTTTNERKTFGHITAFKIWVNTTTTISPPMSYFWQMYLSIFAMTCFKTTV